MSECATNLRDATNHKIFMNHVRFEPVVPREVVSENRVRNHRLGPVSVVANTLQFWKTQCVLRIQRARDARENLFVLGTLQNRTINETETHRDKRFLKPER